MFLILILKEQKKFFKITCNINLLILLLILIICDILFNIKSCIKIKIK